MRHLLVNADDYGYTPGVSAGIRRAHLSGIVTSTSVMMTMPPARAELETLRAEAPALATGVHLTLTEGMPFRLPAFPSPKNLPTALAEISSLALREEWRAQIDTFLGTGLKLIHLDSHHHAAYRHEKALEVLLDLAGQYRVPVRNPYPIAGVDAPFASRWFAASGVSHPGHFLDVFDGIRPSVEAFLEALGALAEGTTEFMVHPGVVDDELRRLCPDFSEPRAQELAVLTDPRLREAMPQLPVELVDYRVFHQGVSARHGLC